MEAKQLLEMGYKEGPVIGLLLLACKKAEKDGLAENKIITICQKLLEDPHAFKIHGGHFDQAAKKLVDMQKPSEYVFEPREYSVWGRHLLDQDTINQMERAIELPIAVRGALMPDGHKGYGLPIGGVLACENAVIPFAVGVDIACRMKMSILPEKIKPGEESLIDRYKEEFKKAIANNTRFGMGAEFEKGLRRQHEVMDLNWNVTKITAQLKDLAAKQLGSSGSGNHFVDICEIEFAEEFRGIPAGKYVAIMTHSGSRGPGSKIATHYSRVARLKHPRIPNTHKELSWLELGNDGDGEEYWSAMQLMGEFASANHDCIHRDIMKDLNMQPLMQIENHHNFAWKEHHHGKEVIVHRKGATPAGPGVMGIIPGSMADYAFLVEGKGHPESLHSSSHGAGRTMSRRQANKTFDMDEERGKLRMKGVELISAGKDEMSGAYKDIELVMAEQDDLVTVIARLFPRIVKMSDDGKAED